jgi:phage I-like protein
MPDEFTKEQAQSIVSDSTHPDHARLYGPNGDGEGGDPALKAAIERAYAKADPQRDREIRLEYGIAPISPEDLTKPRTNEEYRAELDKQFANWEAEQKAKGETAPAAVGEVDAKALAAVDQKVASTLTDQWGDAYTENCKLAGEMMGTIFETREEMAEWGRKNGVTRNPEIQAKIMDLLAELGRSRR